MRQKLIRLLTEKLTVTFKKALKNSLEACVFAIDPTVGAYSTLPGSLVVADM